MGDPAILAAKLRGFTRKGFVNIDVLGQLLPHGVSGATMDAGADSMAVLYTDLPGPVLITRATGAGVEWRDEFGKPLDSTKVDLARGPVVVELKGDGPNSLMNIVLRGLR